VLRQREEFKATIGWMRDTWQIRDKIDLLSTFV
jgi:hypothetical protein